LPGISQEVTEQFCNPLPRAGAANVSCGLNSAVSGFLRHGCFTPETGHWLARLARPKSATSRLMHRSKKQSADEQISAKA